MSVNFSGLSVITGRVIIAPGDAPIDPQAQVTGEVTGGVITGITITNSGANYCGVQPSVLVISPGYGAGGSPASFYVGVNPMTCEIDSVSVLDGGSGYLNGGNGTVSIVISEPQDPWSQQRIPSVSDESNGQYGTQVAISADGTKMLVTAPRDNTTNGVDCGTARYYERGTGANINEWSLVYTIGNEGGIGLGANDLLGTSMAMTPDATTVVIGAPNDDDAGSNAGALYVFTRDPQSFQWQYEDKITPSNAASGFDFGNNVSISDDGNTIIAGDPNYDAVTNSEGRVYWYTRSGSVWTEQTSIYPSVQYEGARFGTSIKISADGNHLLVADEGGNNYPGESYQGHVFYYTRAGNTWTQQQIFQSNDVADDDSFGQSISMSADASTAAIGSNTSPNQSVYIFARSGNTWTQTLKISAPVAGFVGFGSSLQILPDGSKVLVGSAQFDSLTPDAQLGGTPTEQDGKFYIIDTTTGAIDNEWITAYARYWQHASRTVAISSNGDTIVAGAPNYPSDGHVPMLEFESDNVGSVFITTSTPTPAPDYSFITAEVPGSYEYFGVSTDITDDNLTLVVGVTGSTPQSIHVLNSPTWSQDTVLTSPGGTNEFGRVTKISGDGSVIVTSDPYLAVTALTSAGAVYIHSGTDWATQTTVTAASPYSYNYFGTSLGISDDGATIVVGVNDPDVNGVYQAPVLHGTTWGTQTYLSTSDPNVANAWRNSDVDISGDAETVVIGFPFAYTDGVELGGLAKVFTGGAISSWGTEVTLTPSTPNWYSYFGTSVAADSTGETLVVGAPGAPIDGLYSVGTATVFVEDLPGNPGTWIQQGDPLIAPNFNAYSYFGSTVSISADGDTITVSAGVEPNQVYVYERTGSTWAVVGQVANDINFSKFGEKNITTGGDGSTFFVGAPNIDVGTEEGAGAVYQYITADLDAPVVYGAATIIQGTVTDGEFGSAIDISTYGNYVVIGAKGENTAYVYTNIGGWAELDSLTSSQVSGVGSFGDSVGISENGEIVAVSDSTWDTDKGSVDIFVSADLTASSWSPATAVTGTAGEYLGEAMALTGNGDRLIVSKAGTPATAVVYSGGPTWTSASVLDTLTGTAETGAVARSIATTTTGDVIVVGAPDATSSGGAAGDGVVYVFVETVADTWSQTDLLTYTSSAYTNENFGTSVAISATGGVLVVGSPYAPKVSNATNGPGAVYVYTRNGNTWDYFQTLTPPGGGGDGWEFGMSVAISPDELTITVGSPRDSDNNTDQGALFTFAYDFNDTEYAFAAITTTDSNETFTGYSAEVTDPTPQNKTLIFGGNRIANGDDGQVQVGVRSVGGGGP
jgi:hypothetical protein